MEQQSRGGSTHTERTRRGNDVELEKQIGRRGALRESTLQHREPDGLVVSLNRQDLPIGLGQQCSRAQRSRSDVMGRGADLGEPKRLSAREPVAPANGMAYVSKNDRHESKTRYKKRTREMASHHPGFVWELNAPGQ